MGCCCCCFGSKTKSSGKKGTDNEKDSTSRSSSPKGAVFESNDENSDEKKLIEEEKLKEELKNTYKAGESGYGRQRERKKRSKSLSDSQYNQKGVVDLKSREYQMVKDFLLSRDYRLIGPIGSGNYAEVYKAYGNKQNKNVAVKVINLKKTNTDYRKNFLPREVSVLRECKHKNVIKMYEIAQHHNKIFMIMEFAAKGTMTDWLRDNGALTERLAHTMFTEILNAMHFMHNQHIAHRDLKLENILVTDKLIPKISDFSYAIKVDVINPKSTDFCGSIPYFSPELLQRQPYNPLISDVWSLGVCFYIMLNDGLPFHFDDHRLMLQKQLTRNWSFRKKVEPRLSEELKSMIRKMLEPNTNTRATTAQLMEEQWIKNTIN